jgi:hypothetical protein
VEPFGGIPDGGAAAAPLGLGGMPTQAGGGAPPSETGSGGESNGVAGNSPGGADPSGAGGTASGGAPGGAAGTPAGGAAGGGSCYVSGCPGCILSMNSLFGVPCCTAAGKCGCQAAFTTTCM